MISNGNSRAKIANVIINNALDRGCGVNVFLSDSGGLSVSIYQPECVLVDEEDARPLTCCGTVDAAEESAAPEIKCPCHMRDYMTMDDCNETGCDSCCPLRANEEDDADA